MTRIRFFKHPASIPFLAFVCSVLISHVALPMMGKNNLLPFFDWQLFNLLPTQTKYDLVLEYESNRGHEILLSHSQNIHKDIRVRLFYLTQEIGRVAEKFGPKHELSRLLWGNLEAAHLRALRVVRIGVPFHKYLLAGPDQLSENIETVYEFESEAN